MFEDLRAAFREAVDNFNKELNRDQVPEVVDKLLKGMVDEIADAKAHTADLESQIGATLQRAEKEKAEGQTCRRREQMAREIGDNETADVAADFAAKHEEHQRLLEQKAVALQQELEFRRKELDGMMAKVKEAKAKRGSLSATAGRAGARESLSAADDLFSELDRMAEKIEGERNRGEAAEAIGDLDLEGTVDPDYDIHLDEESSPREELDVDAALAELKRRMGHDD